MEYNRAGSIHRDTLIRWGAHSPGRRSFVRAALIAFNKIQLDIADDGDIATLKLLERINEDPHRGRV